MVNTEIRLITFFVAEDGEAVYSQQKQDLKLTVVQTKSFLIAKFRLKLKVGKTMRPVRYDLNQIPYEYTMEVTNRFKGLDLVNRVHEELWTEVHNIVQEATNKTIPKKKKSKKAKWLCEEALQIAAERREAKSKGERERYTQLNRVSENSRGDKKAFNEQCKEIEENNRRGKTRDLFKKIGNIKGWAQ